MKFIRTNRRGATHSVVLGRCVAHCHRSRRRRVNLCDVALNYGGSQPLPPEARIPVTAAFTISAMVSFFLWRWALRSLLSPAGNRDKQHQQQPFDGRSAL